MKRLILTSTVALLLVSFAYAADHREAPLIREDSTADINDLYAFLNPGDPGRLVLAMTVNPFSAPSENTTFNFSPNVRYAFEIDSTGDARSDASVRIRFADGPNGQMFHVRLPDGRRFSGPVTAPTLEAAPNDTIVVDGPDGVKAFAGQVDDPFFFDVVGFNRFLSGTGGFTGVDGFAGFNVSGIVIELPMELVRNVGGDDDESSDESSGSSDDRDTRNRNRFARLSRSASSPLQIWAVSERRRVTLRRSAQGRLETSSGPWEQVDRMGNPAVNTALIPGGLKDFYNIGQPRRDAEDFAGAIVGSLQSLGTNAENIGILASVAVPDTLKLDPTQTVGYPNGRKPADDVVDTLLFFIFNQTPVADGADGNEKPFRAEFPYFAEPHQPD